MKQYYKQYYKEYCAGCGLCECLKYTKLEYSEDGFPYPDGCSDEMISFCDNVCPMGKKYVSKRSSTNLWGNFDRYVIGYSNNNETRRKASSGGIITEICAFLIETKKVDGIIQVKCSEDDPTETVTVVSNTVEDVLLCSGSRYSVSMPLINILDLIDDKKKYAFVGKPCDVAAIRNYSKENIKVNNAIIYYFSFFCAGTPSRTANEKMLKVLGCSKDECVSFNYRGNGWPGKVTAIDKSGKKYEMDYYSAWMNVLGRIIKKSCKFCVDSIGESADISCGDYWYLDENGAPSFEENEGRNCIFAWNSKGSELLDELQQRNRITLFKDSLDRLNKVQPNHFNRRSTILYKWIAMKMFFRKVPPYSMKKMIGLAKQNSKKQGYYMFKGTVKRIIQRKI